MQCEMQSVSSRIWTRVVVSISNDDNHYTTSTSIMSESDTMFNERDRRCAAVQLCSLTIQVMTTGPLTAPSKCKSGRFNAWGHSSTHRTTTVMVFSVVSTEGHIMPPHIFEVGLKVNTKVYQDVLKSVVIPWCNQVARGRLWVWH